MLIAGAGAAGLTAAIFAAQNTRQGSSPRVVLLERTPQTGRKILMSGGTRCNVLPVRVGPEDFITSSSPNRLRNILKSWTLEECFSWFEHDLGLQMSCEQESDKWFPASNSAREVRDVLLKRARQLGVEVRTGASVNHLHHNGKRWIVHTDSGETFTAPFVIMAMGGSSIPSSGTDGIGYRLAQALGHDISEPYPALTPLLGAHPGGEPLPGITLEAGVRVGGEPGHAFQEKRSGFLFTHKGFSGPAVLDVSDHAVRRLAQGKQPLLLINWNRRSEEWWMDAFGGPKTTTTLLREHLPRRLADALLEQSGLEGRKTAELNKKVRTRLLDLLTAWPATITGHGGFKKAEVTGGGVPLEQIYTATMASTVQPGLFLCGEILDVFGRIGGFNFYWAWVTGRLAGKSALRAWRAHT